MDPSSVAERRRIFGTRLHSETNNGEGAALSGRKVKTVVLVLFGVLCMTQATLNIVLRLYLTEDRGVDPVCENVTAQRDDLQQQYWTLQTSHQTLSKQRDELEQQYWTLQTSHQTLSKQRDELEQQLHSIKSNSAQKWSFVRGSFYLGDTLMLSWKDSRQYCLDRGADLIIINSQEEQEFAWTFEEHSWIGLTDMLQEGVWRWVDGSLPTTSFWYPGEPNDNEGNEDCVEVSHSKPKHASWDDMSCDTLRKFICEKTVQRSTEREIISEAQPYSV